MQQYTIAGLVVEVSGYGLNHIPGFDIFLSYNKENNAGVKIHLGKQIVNRTIYPLYCFKIEDSLCEFAKVDTGYYFHIISADKNDLLMEMKLLEESVFITTNMDVHTPSHLLRFAVWLAFGIYSVSKHTVAVHSSAVIYKDKAILFLGESGTGKSTHARLWLEHIPNTELLNDDSPFVYADEKKAIAFGSPWSGKSPCFKNKHTPIAGIVRLSKAPCNKIVKLSKISAIGALLPSCPPAFAYDEYLSDRICEILSFLIQQVPVYSLECVPDESAAKLVFSTLKNEGYL